MRNRVDEAALEVDWQHLRSAVCGHVKMRGSASRCFTESGGERAALDAATANLRAGDAGTSTVSATPALSRLEVWRKVDECVYASHPKNPRCGRSV